MTFVWSTNFNFWRANGTDLTTPYALNMSTPGPSQTLVRTLFDCALSVQVNQTGTSGVFPDNWWYDVVATIGMVALPPGSATPDIIGSPDGIDWIFLQTLRGKQQIYDLTNLNQQVSFEPAGPRLDVHSQRKFAATSPDDIWLCVGWDDDSGVINSTGGGLYTAYIGGWAHWRFLFDVP